MLYLESNDSSYEERIGRSLVVQGKLDITGLDRAKRLQADSDERLTSILTKLGLVSERDLVLALAKELKLPVVTESDFPSTPIRKGELSARFLKSMRVLPLEETDDQVVIAVADPFNDYVLDSLGLITGKTVERALAEPSAIEGAIERLYEGAKASAPIPGPVPATMATLFSKITSSLLF